MSYYVEITLNVYDDRTHTVGVGHYLTYEKARVAAMNIEARLRRGAAKASLDEKYGSDLEYGLSVTALRLRTPSEAIAELIEQDA